MLPALSYSVKLAELTRRNRHDSITVACLNNEAAPRIMTSSLVVSATVSAVKVPACAANFSDTALREIASALSASAVDVRGRSAENGASLRIDPSANMTSKTKQVLSSCFGRPLLLLALEKCPVEHEEAE